MHLLLNARNWINDDIIWYENNDLADSVYSQT